MSSFDLSSPQITRQLTKINYNILKIIEILYIYIFFLIAVKNFNIDKIYLDLKIQCIKYKNLEQPFYKFSFYIEDYILLKYDLVIL